MSLLLKTINIIKLSQKYKYFSCNVPKSQLILSFLKVLSANGLINGFQVLENKNIVFLRYDKRGYGILQNIQHFSPSKKFFKKKKELFSENTSMGVIVSTTSGFFVEFKNFLNVYPKGGYLICKF